MNIYIKYLNTRYGPYATGVPLESPTTCVRDPILYRWSGSLSGDTRNGYPPRIDVQVLLSQFGGNWCASNWETIPVDELWQWMGRPRSLSTHTFLRRLDFRNTAFELRFNLNDRMGGGVTPLYQLADLERATWGDSYCEFIPFKRPHPQGYKGVWGNFDTLLKNLMADCFPVNDVFESGVHILKLGWGF